MALRLPGGISTPNQFWDFLVKKQDARGLVPKSGYNSSSFYSKSRKPGHVAIQYGYFLDESVDIGALDTSFFRMPKIEVERADPHSDFYWNLQGSASKAPEKSTTAARLLEPLLDRSVRTGWNYSLKIPSYMVPIRLLVMATLCFPTESHTNMTSKDLVWSSAPVALQL